MQALGPSSVSQVWWQGAGLEAEQLRLELASWSEMLVAEEAECTVLGHCDLALLHD